MHRYETSTPRVAFGIAAVAMTAITIGVLVVMPVRMEADSHAWLLLDAVGVEDGPTGATSWRRRPSFSG